MRVNSFPKIVLHKISYFSFFLIRRRFMRIPCLFWTCSDWDERVRTLLSSKDDIFCSRGHCSLPCDENQLLRPRRGLFIFEAAAVLASSTRFQPRPRPRPHMHAARVHTLSLCSPCKDLPRKEPSRSTASASFEQLVCERLPTFSLPEIYILIRETSFEYIVWKVFILFQ